MQSERIIGRQADIDALRRAGIIQGVLRTGAVPEDLRRLPEDRVVIVMNPAQAAELFNGLKSPRVRTTTHPYSNGKATLSAACALCTPTAAIGYGGGRISFAAGCHNGVKIEVSTTGDFKSSLSNGPYSIAVGVATGADQQHTAINSPAGVSVSASAGCRNGAKARALQVSTTAVELSVTGSAPEVPEVTHVRDGRVAPVGTGETRDQNLDETANSMVGDERTASAPKVPEVKHLREGLVVPVGTGETRDQNLDETANSMVGDERAAIEYRLAAGGTWESPARDTSSVDAILAEWVCAINAESAWRRR